MKANIGQTLSKSKIFQKMVFAEIHKTQPLSAQPLIGEIIKIEMLIRNLYFLFCGSEPQNGRSDCASPDVIEEKERIVIRPEKFKDDIQKLQDYCGVELRSGLCIELELSELLEILPRERRRKDAYDKLVKFLADEMNIKLNIKSRNYGNRRND